MIKKFLVTPILIFETDYVCERKPTKRKTNETKLTLFLVFKKIHTKIIINSVITTILKLRVEYSEFKVIKDNQYV